MEFSQAISKIADVLEKVGTPIDIESYDGVIVKKMESSNTLDEGRTTNQTHIAITGAQMDIFPYLRADGYFNANESDASLKKFFIVQIPVTIYESNFKYICAEYTDLVFVDGKRRGKTSVVRSMRKKQADQIQLSMINFDSNDFVQFRKNMHTGCFWILLKKKGIFEYETFAVIPGKGIDGDGGLQELNNGFYKLSTNTIISTDDFEEIIECEPLEKDYTIEELGSILAAMYNDAANKPASIHMFGLKYAPIILEKDYPITKIIAASGIPASYKEEVRKGIKIFESIDNNEYGVKFYEDEAVSRDDSGSLPNIPARSRTTHPLNVILYGAPGTGKTYSTALYALAIAENSQYETIASEPRSDVMNRYNALVSCGRIVFTTFHQNYGYEDFIQGIRPDTSSGNMAFKTVDGVFKKIANKAILHPEHDYVIIIDEINRANISKVFGELITLIENDKRWGEINAINVTLPSGENFAVPNNLYIIGTMNSADKSISLIDTALRRRFDFVEFEPKADLIADQDLRKILLKLNEGIASELGSTDLLIGHSYFIGRTIDDLCDIMNRNIIPLLYEYFFDNQKKVEAQIKNATSGYDVEVKAGTVGRIKITTKGAV